jgi:hypothetical protein
MDHLVRRSAPGAPPRTASRPHEVCVWRHGATPFWVATVQPGSQCKFFLVERIYV